MQIQNDFALALPPQQAYALLLDLDRVAPCMPGARLGGPVGDGARAVEVTVKLGPMKFVYDGTVRIAERDDAARSALLIGAAREKRGQGNAEARIRMTVSAGESGGSRIASVADVDLTGRAAQTGRGIVEDVARRMIGQMAACLEADVCADPAIANGRPSTGPHPNQAAKPIAGGRLLLSLIWSQLRRLLRWRPKT